MLTPRQDRILAMVRTDTSVRVEELVRILSVSEATVRRELQMLEELGMIRRVRGGAVTLPDGATPPLPPPTDRERDSLAEKRRIAEVAAREVRDGSTIFLDAGSTTKQMVPFLTQRKGLTVITRDVWIAGLLLAHPHIQLVLLGGSVQPGAGATTGGHTLAMLRHFYADKAFLGAYGLSVEGGVTTANAEEALLKAEMVHHSEETIVLADASKVGRKSGAFVAQLEQFCLVVTDSRVSDEAAALLHAAGPEVMRV